MHLTKILHSFSLAAILLVTVLATSANARTKWLTVVSWGGAYSQSQIKALHKPFQKKHGARLTAQVYSGGLERIKRQIAADKVTWDVVDVELRDARAGCEQGLFAKIDPATLQEETSAEKLTADFIPGGLQDCAVANIVWSTIFAFNPKKFKKQAPSTIADFFDLTTYPGKRGMRRSPVANLEFALMADDVPVDDVYTILATKEGADIAFAKLDTIKDKIIWWTDGSEPAQLLNDGDVVMTTGYAARIFGAVLSRRKPLTIVWDAQIWDANYWAILQEAPHKTTAFEFLKFAIKPEQMAAQTKYIAYSPARKSALATVDKYKNNKTDMKPFMPTDPANFKNALRNDSDFWAKRRVALTRRFEAWLKKDKSPVTPANVAAPPTQAPQKSK